MRSFASTILVDNQSITIISSEYKIIFVCLPFWNFDFNKTPLAPLGTKILIHTKQQNRDS